MHSTQEPGGLSPEDIARIEQEELVRMNLRSQIELDVAREHNRIQHLNMLAAVSTAKRKYRMNLMIAAAAAIGAILFIGLMAWISAPSPSR